MLPTPIFSTARQFLLPHTISICSTGRLISCSTVQSNITQSSDHLEYVGVESGAGGGQPGGALGAVESGRREVGALGERDTVVQTHFGRLDTRTECIRTELAGSYRLFD